MINFLKKIKRTNFWKYFIEYLFYPFFHFFWSYILNFHAKILYFLWKLKKKKYFNLKNNDKLLVDNNDEFKKIGNKIYNETSDFLDGAKKRIFHPDYAKELQVNAARAEAPYEISLYENLSENLKKEIIEFASSDQMVSTAANYMKIFPILTRVEVSLNIPRPGTDLRAAMFWHKDGFGFKNLDFFMTVTEVDENNGPFYCLEKKIRAGIFKSFDNFMTRTGERNKVPLHIFDKQFENSDIIKLIGKSGKGIFLDSFSTFHRGGFCKSKDRVMLRFCYQSHDAFCENFFINKDYYIYDQSINKKNTKNIFKKFLYFKKPSIFMKFLTNKLIRFYYLVECKYRS